MEAPLKVGDYIANDITMLLEIMAIVPGSQGNVYAVRNVKDLTKLTWYTDHEIKNRNFVKKTPDFARYRKLKEGDIINVGLANKQAYCEVLARINDIVLLSSVAEREKSELVTKMAEQIEKLTGGGVELLSESERREVQQMGSISHARKVAESWIEVDTICLMNWDIISDE